MLKKYACILLRNTKVQKLKRALCHQTNHSRCHICRLATVMRAFRLHGSAQQHCYSLTALFCFPYIQSRTIRKHELETVGRSDCELRGTTSVSWSGPNRILSSVTKKNIKITYAFGRSPHPHSLTMCSRAFSRLPPPSHFALTPKTWPTLPYTVKKVTHCVSSWTKGQVRHRLCHLLNVTRLLRAGISLNSQL